MADEPPTRELWASIASRASMQFFSVEKKFFAVFGLFLALESFETTRTLVERGFQARLSFAAQGKHAESRQ